jgi:hypothetical protein
MDTSMRNDICLALFDADPATRLAAALHKEDLTVLERAITDIVRNNNDWNTAVNLLCKQILMAVLSDHVKPRLSQIQSYLEELEARLLSLYFDVEDGEKLYLMVPLEHQGHARMD